jgi:hypothetical protein
MNTLVFTRQTKRYARIGDTLIIQTEGATVEITLGNVTRVTTKPQAGYRAESLRTDDNTQVTRVSAIVTDRKVAAARPQAAKPQAAKPQAAKVTEPAPARPQATKPQAAKVADACKCGRVHRAGSQAAKRCQDATQAATRVAKPQAAKPQAAKPQAAKPQAAKPQAAKVTKPQATEPAPADLFTATVTFRNMSTDTRTGIMPEVTAWLAAHNPGIVLSVTVLRTEPAPAKPQAAKPQAAKPQAAKPQAAKPAYRVHTEPVPDTAAGRRLAALRARHAAA